MSSLPPFTPGNSIVATVATSSAQITLPVTHGNQVLVSSLAANAIAYVAFGADPTVVIPTGTAANGVPILPGTQRIFTVPGAVGQTVKVATIGTAGNTLIFTCGDGEN